MNCAFHVEIASASPDHHSPFHSAGIPNTKTSKQIIAINVN